MCNIEKLGGLGMRLGFSAIQILSTRHNRFFLEWFKDLSDIHVWVSAIVQPLSGVDG